MPFSEDLTPQKDKGKNHGAPPPTSLELNTEKKKWYIDRIEKGLDGNIAEIESSRQYFLKQAGRDEMAVTSTRNAIIAAVSLGATIFLGLMSIDHLRDFLLQLLAVDIIVGLTSYIVLTVIKDRAFFMLTKIDVSYLTTSGKLVNFKVFLASKTFDLDSVDLKLLEFYFKYYLFALGAVKVSLMNKL